MTDPLSGARWLTGRHAAGTALRALAC